MLPGGNDAILVRTDFSDQRVWNGLLGRLRQDTDEGLFSDSRIVDDPSFAEMALDRLLTLIPDIAGYAFIAVADRPDHTVLIVDLDDEGGGQQFRCEVSRLASVAANLDSGNMDFSDYTDTVGDDGVFREFLSPPSQATLAVHVEGRPMLTELLPNGTLRLGSMTSPSGGFLLVNQDDGDVVLYRGGDGTAVWRTGTRLAQELHGLSSRLVLRDTGDLVLYEPTGVPVWTSGTAGSEVQRAVISDDGRLLLIGAGGVHVWASDNRHD